MFQVQELDSNEMNLISFGNYLLERYGVMVYSNDGTNVPLYQRQVDNADLCNWRDECNPKKDGEALYPSRYSIGDKVKVFLMPEGEDRFPGFIAHVVAVHFTNSKVKYDLEVKFAGDFSTRIYNVDSILISDIE